MVINQLYVYKAQGKIFVKIDQSQNMDQSTSLERCYQELLNAMFSFEIRCS